MPEHDHVLHSDLILWVVQLNLKITPTLFNNAVEHRILTKTIYYNSTNGYS